MIDTGCRRTPFVRIRLLRHKERALTLDVVGRYGLEPGRGHSRRPYALLTLHRPSNVDVPEVLAGILDALAEIQVRLPILFPAHPRTVERIQEFGFDESLAAMPSLRVTEPLGYLEFLNLMANARLVLTDLEAQRLPSASRRRRRSWVCPFDRAQGRPA